MTKAAAKFNPEKIKMDDLARQAVRRTKANKGGYMPYFILGLSLILYGLSLNPSALRRDHAHCQDYGTSCGLSGQSRNRGGTGEE